MIQLLHIFWSFFKIGLFTFGGGYTMIMMMQREITQKNNWMEEKEFMDYLSLAQASPGPMAVNTAILIGYRQHKLAGGIAGFLGSTLPSFIILLLIAVFFQDFSENPEVMKVFNGLRPSVVALILYTVFVFARNIRKWEYPLFIAVAGLILLGISPLYLICIGIIAGVAYTYYKTHKSK